ncbi:MAG: hypothetical protein R2726_15200 [Acidimicrobiales bacterium]
MAAHDRPTWTPELATLERRLAAQECELAELRREVRQLRRAPSAPTPGDTDLAAGETTAAALAHPDEHAGVAGHAGVGEPCLVDRRGLLRRAGMAAGAAVAGTALVTGTAEPAEAATLIGSGNPGVRGDGIGGDGVVGNTDQPGASGVYGNTSTTGAVGITARHLAGGVALEAIASGTVYGTGVVGRGSEAGVYGIAMGSGEGFGVVGVGRVGGTFNGDAANAALPRTSLDPPPTLTSAGSSGMLINDKDGALWFCATNGVPGTWRELAGPTSAGSLHILPASTRIYDSRPGEAPLNVTKGLLVSGAERIVSCLQGTAAGVVPIGTTGILVNITVTSTSAAGWVSAYKTGLMWPGTSTINWSSAGTTIANSAVVALSSLYQLTLKVSPGSSTHVIVDAIGYYR